MGMTILQLSDKVDKNNARRMSLLSSRSLWTQPIAMSMVIVNLNFKGLG